MREMTLAAAVATMAAAACSGTMSVMDGGEGTDAADIQADDSPADAVGEAADVRDAADPAVEDPAEALPETVPEAVDGPEEEDGADGCVRGSDPLDFVCAEGDSVRLVEIPLVPGVDYTRATVSFEFVPSDWHGGCYNPVYTPPRWVAVFNYVVELRRGTHWCRGGNIFSLTLRGPDESQILFDTYYKDAVAPDCSSYTEHRILDPHPRHDLALGEAHPVVIEYDAASGSASLDIDGGALRFTGETLPEARIVTDGSHAFYLAFGLDLFVECYNELGEEDPGAACCHVPPVGWQFRGLSYAFCP